MIITSSVILIWKFSASFHFSFYLLFIRSRSIRTSIVLNLERKHSYNDYLGRIISTIAEELYSVLHWIFHLAHLSGEFSSKISQVRHLWVWIGTEGLQVRLPSLPISHLSSPAPVSFGTELNLMTLLSEDISSGNCRIQDRSFNVIYIWTTEIDI